MSVFSLPKSWSTVSGWLGFLVVVALAAVLIGLVGWFFHGPTGRDDVYKTFWPAHALATEGRIVNYNDEPVEQSSSLLQVIVLAAGYKVLPFQMQGIALVLGIFWAACCVGLIWRSTFNLLGRGVWAVLLIALAPPLIYWSWSGMETTLAACAVAFFLHETISAMKAKRSWAWWVSAAMVLLVRPEMAMVAVFGLALTIVFLWRSRSPKETSKNMMIALGLIVVLAAVMVAVRLAWTGNIFPQPVIAKEAPGQFRYMEGVKYIVRSALFQPVWILLGLAAMLGFVQALRGKWKVEIVLPASWAFAHVTITVVSGGDWMEGSRLIVPVIPALALTFFLSLENLGRFSRAIASVVFVAGSVYGSWHLLKYESVGSPAWARFESRHEPSFHWTEHFNRIHARDKILIGKLREQVDRHWAIHGKKPVILSQQAGMVMYHLSRSHFGRFRFVDLVGLCSTDFTDCELTRNRGSGYGGVNMDLFYWSSNKEEIQRKCGVPVADIIFDLDHESRFKQIALEEAGYEVVWSDSGSVGGTEWGAEVENGQFLAVKVR